MIRRYLDLFEAAWVEIYECDVVAAAGTDLGEANQETKATPWFIFSADKQHQVHWSISCPDSSYPSTSFALNLKTKFMSLFKGHWG